MVADWFRFAKASRPFVPVHGNLGPSTLISPKLGPTSVGGERRMLLRPYSNIQSPNSYAVWEAAEGKRKSSPVCCFGPEGGPLSCLSPSLQPRGWAARQS